MDNRYIPKLCGIIKKNKHADGKQLWCLFCQDYYKEKNQRQGSFFSCFACSSPNPSNFINIASHYASQLNLEEKEIKQSIKNKKSEESKEIKAEIIDNFFFTFLNSQLQGKKFLNTDPFLQLLKAFLTIHPQYRYYIDKNIIESLHLNPYFVIEHTSIDSFCLEVIKMFGSDGWTVRNAASNAVIAQFKYLTSNSQQEVLKQLLDLSSRQSSTNISLTLDTKKDTLANLYPYLNEVQQKQVITTLVNLYFDDSDSDHKTRAIGALIRLYKYLNLEDQKLVSSTCLANVKFIIRNNWLAPFDNILTMFNSLDEEDQPIAIKALIDKIEAPDDSSKSIHKDKKVFVLKIILNLFQFDQKINSIQKESIMKTAINFLGIRSSEIQETESKETEEKIQWPNQDILALIPKFYAQLNVEAQQQISNQLLKILGCKENSDIAVSATIYIYPYLDYDQKHLFSTAIYKIIEEDESWFTRGYVLSNISFLYKDLDADDQSKALTTVYGRLKDESRNVRLKAVAVLTNLYPQLNPDERRNAIDHCFGLINDNFIVQRAVMDFIVSLESPLAPKQQQDALTLMSDMLDRPYDIDCRGPCYVAIASLFSKLTEHQQKLAITLIFKKLSSEAINKSNSVMLLLTLYPKLSPNQQPSALNTLNTIIIKELTTQSNLYIVEMADLLKQHANKTDNLDETFEVLLPILFNALKQNQHIIIKTLVLDIISTYLNKMNDTQKNYFIYGMMYDTLSAEQQHPHYATLTEIMAIICSQRAEKMKVTNEVVNITEIPGPLADLSTQYLQMY